jgi:transcriptional regulator with PAS, ATPase and Fis domain
VDGEKIGAAGALVAFGSVLRVGGTLLVPVPNVDVHAVPARVIAARFLGLSRDLVAGPSYAQTLDEAARLAPLPTPVLISGESGTGKEGVARMIHASSGRPGAFVGLNIAAVPDNLFESEMFGHARGAFTGADAARLGAFREAEGGTIFLDEIADLRPDLQVKLLRVLDLQQVRPLGGKAEQRIDVRFVAATHRDLDKLCAAGSFRLDLYYRLRGAVLRVAPLRERRDDVVLLALAAIREQSETCSLSVDAAEALAMADWEGNVRNLNRAVTEAVCKAVASKDAVVRRRHLPDLGPVAGESESLLAKRQIANAMAESEGNATRAAKLLGISRVTLYRACKRLDFDIGEERARRRSTS